MANNRDNIIHELAVQTVIYLLGPRESSAQLSAQLNYTRYFSDVFSTDDLHTISQTRAAYRNRKILFKIHKTVRNFSYAHKSHLRKSVIGRVTPQ